MNATNAEATKVGKVANNLARIKPNINAVDSEVLKSINRKLLSNVVHSEMLYGSPSGRIIWIPEDTKYYLKCIERQSFELRLFIVRYQVKRLG